MFIEFSYPIVPGEVVLGSDIKLPAVTARSRFADGGHSNTSYLELFAHTGTHIDLPWHMIDQGAKVLDYSIGDFVFSRVSLVDLPFGDTSQIEISDLRRFQGDLKASDAILIRTGFGGLRRSDPQRYISDNPSFSPEAAQFLADFPDLRCIGVDWFSIENVGLGRQTGFPIHRLFLGRSQPVLLLEDANLAALPAGPIRRIYLFPFRMDGLEASPVTAVAEMTA